MRVEKDQLSNSTVKGQAVSDIVDGALERYREAYGIEEGKSAAGHNTIVNMADFKALKQLLPRLRKCSMRQSSLCLQMHQHHPRQHYLRSVK